MALKKKPVTGMKDILPKEMVIRNYVMNMIRETYGTFGFSAIETPCVEHIENLCSKIGRLTQDIDITLHKLTETTSLRTVSSPYISHLKCLKRSRKLVCIIGIISGKRYGQVIAKSGICQIILCFCSIQFQFLASLHDLEDQFFIFTALLAAEGDS